MQSTRKIFVLLLASLLFSNLATAQNWNGWNGIKGEGAKVKKTLELADFSGFTMAISGNVYLKQGSKQSVIVEAQQNIIDNILTQVTDKEWKIKFDKNVRNHDGIKVFITLPTLTKAYVSGSGDIIGETKFTGLGNLMTGISGSGNINLAVEAKDIEGKISGSGSVKLTGSANGLTIGISGSGDFIADGLKSQSGTISISGSGDCTVDAQDALTVKVSGSGDVKYKGRPRLSAKVSGSGEVDPM
jgi:hypothetical protein